MHVHLLPGAEMALGGTMGERQAGEGNLMLWALIYWEILGPGVYVDVTLTCITYLNTLADQDQGKCIQ